MVDTPSLSSWEEFDINDQSQWPALGTKPRVELLPVSANSKPTESFLSDAALRAAHPYFDSQPVVKILPRKKAGEEGGLPRSGSTGDLTDSDGRGRKTLEQREREYAEARRRILGDEAAPVDSRQGSAAKPARNTSSGISSGSNDTRMPFQRKPAFDEDYQRNYRRKDVYPAAMGGDGPSAPGVPILPTPLSSLPGQQLPDGVRFEPHQYVDPFSPNVFAADIPPRGAMFAAPPNSHPHSSYSSYNGYTGGGYNAAFVQHFQPY